MEEGRIVISYETIFEILRVERSRTELQKLPDSYSQEMRKLIEDDKGELNGLIEKLKDSHSKKEMENIKTYMDDLNSKFQSISQKMYESTSDDVPEGDGIDVEASDVEFEEVK